VSAWRPALAERALLHPRHVVLVGAVAGLLGGGRLPAAALAAAALALAAAALVVPLVARPAAAAALAAVVIAAACVAQERTAALERTRLGPDVGRSVAGTATVLAAPRADAFGGRRVLVRFRDEPVLLRVAGWSAGTRAAGPPALGAGEVLAVAGRLRPPDLAARAVHAHATLRATAVRSTGRRRGGLLGVVDGVRRRAEDVLAAHLPGSEAALLRGMVLGDDGAMPDADRDAFTAASLSHLTAASGQNVALLAALALGIGAIAGIGIRLRWALVLALIAIYVPLAGGGASIQRAGVMGGATIVAALAGRPASRWYGLLLAATATLALDPRAAGDAGWQLSFAAVVGIALLAGSARDRLRGRGVPRALAEATAVTLAATIATAPLIALRFDQASLVAIPANVLVAPAVAPVMWLGMSAAALGQVAPAAGGLLVAPAGPLLGYVIGVARAAARVPGAQADVPTVAVAAACALAAALLAWRRGDPAPAGARPRLGRRRRLTAMAAAAVAVLAAAALLLVAHRGLAPPPAGTLRVTALDVGQGDATLLQAGGHAVLVDAGPPGAGIVAALRRAGVGRLDALVVTHPQADHDGGAPAVLAALPVGLLLDGRGGDRSATSSALDGPLRRHGTRITAAQAGQVVRAGPLTLQVLWPPAGPAAPGTDPNDRAVVAVAGAYGARALLTADAESPVLAPLALPAVDVLKVSHHGSADPGLPAVLDRLRPRVALIEVGAHNTYGHPTPSTLAALRAAVPIVRRTDQDGTLRVDVAKGAATVATAR
jgi:competence protein ComEC